MPLSQYVYILHSWNKRSLVKVTEDSFITKQHIGFTRTKKFRKHLDKLSKTEADSPQGSPSYGSLKFKTFQEPFHDKYFDLQRPSSTLLPPVH